jgi:hypothetical protein
MVHLNAPLGEDLLQIAVRDGVTNIEKHGVQDHRLWIVYALEINHLQHPEVTD